jgi:N-acetylglucosamine-6-phosphate deacetylase
MLALCNAVIFDGTKMKQDCAVLIENDGIVGLIPKNEIPSAAEQLLFTETVIAPAFIDLQIYGAGSHLFSNSLTEEALKTTDNYCVKGGCSRFLITIATNTMEVFVKGMEVVHDFLQQQQTGLMGVHMEGPYINKEKRGAHLEGCIHPPTPDEIKMLLNKSNGSLKMMTIAPEVCSDEVIELLQQQNIILSAGHSNATYQLATTAFDKGIKTATHLFNAMSPLQSREPGMVGAIYNHPSVCSSIVCDGIHVDYAAVSISKKIMKERLFLITDAVAAVREGAYQHIFQKDRFALPDGILSGSALTMIQAINNCVDHAGIPFEEALRMASLYPAQVMRLDHKLGKVEKGYKADLVFLNNKREVTKLMRDGKFIDAV